MANKPLQSIKFPGLSDTYIVPQIDNTLTQTGQAADAKVVGDKIDNLKSAVNNVTDFNGLGCNIFKIGSDVPVTKNGLTITRVSDNAINVDGLCETAFNVNIAPKSYSVKGGATGHYMIKTEYATYGTDVFVQVGWFTSADVANNGKKISVANQYVDVTYAAEAAKSREYIHFNAGASFSNVVFEFINTYEYPLNRIIGEINENVQTVQAVADTALYTNISDYAGISLGWEIGGIVSTTGKDDNSTTSRLRTVKFIVGRGSEIITDSHIGAYLYFYNSDGSYNQSEYAIIATSGKYTFETDAVVRVAIRKSDYSVFSDAELATYPAYLIVNRTIPQTFFSRQYVTEEEFEAAFDGDVNIPGYFSTNLESAIESARDNITECGIDGDSFFMLSDLHWENNSKHSGALIAKANDKLNAGKIICCGDVINGTAKVDAVDNMASAINSYKNITRFYCLLGNHDLNGIGTTAQDQLTRDEAYALINKESDFVMQYGEPCYYYFDNPTTKTRYICLDTGTNGNLGTDQNAWLTNVLSDTPENWHILIFAHLLYTADSWQAGLQPSDLHMTTYFTALCTQFDAYNASNNGKTIEAIFGGHTHIDANFTTTGGIPIVLIDTDSRGTYSSAGGTANTVNEQCVDIVTIKYKGTNSQGSIKCARIGRGSNRVINY